MGETYRLQEVSVRCMKDMIGSLINVSTTGEDGKPLDEVFILSQVVENPLSYAPAVKDRNLICLAETLGGDFIPIYDNTQVWYYSD